MKVVVFRDACSRLSRAQNGTSFSGTCGRQGAGGKRYSPLNRKSPVLLPVALCRIGTRPEQGAELAGLYYVPLWIGTLLTSLR